MSIFIFVFSSVLNGVLIFWRAIDGEDVFEEEDDDLDRGLGGKLSLGKFIKIFSSFDVYSISESIRISLFLISLFDSFISDSTRSSLCDSFKTILVGFKSTLENFFCKFSKLSDFSIISFVQRLFVFFLF